MGAMAFDESLGFQIGPKPKFDQGVVVVEELQGLIKVYKNGHVERSPIMSCVTPILPLELEVIARDVFIDNFTNVWARIYVPKCNEDHKFPLLVYFHGGGFCLGSASWKCYHDFLGRLSSQSKCIIVSVNYRLAPENPLPTAYEDGIKALMWLKQQANCPSSEWWSKHCNFSCIFLGGDSSGANLAYNVALKLTKPQIDKLLSPITLKGIIMIQPFIGGEERTNSEKTMVQSYRSKLSLSASDTYWRLALPVGANRDHPWCNPLKEKSSELRGLRLMVCIAEMDILKDRNLELCSMLANVGNKVEQVICQGVGHAFQVLDRSQLSQTRRQELISHIISFICQ